MTERQRIKRIDRHTDPELDAAVEAAVARFGDDFWIMLHGIDAYMCRRKRRDDQRAAANVDFYEDPWGNS